VGIGYRVWDNRGVGGNLVSQRRVWGEEGKKGVSFLKTVKIMDL